MMPRGTIELTGLKLDTRIGTYGPNDVVPEAHLLDVTLTIAPSLVLVDRDAMECVFDYDPLIAEIDRLAKDQHYETQEYLLTRIARACAACGPVEAVDLFLYKHPVLEGSGQLGVRLQMQAEDLVERGL